MTVAISYTVFLAHDPGRNAFNVPSLEEARSMVAYHTTHGGWADAGIYRKTELYHVDEIFGMDVLDGEPVYEFVEGTAFCPPIPGIPACV